MRSFFGLLFNHLEKYNVKYALWIVQVLLAAMFLFAGSMKLVMPIEMLADQTPLPGLFIRFIGVAETLGALGLILPGLLRLRPRLTVLAAIELAHVMVGAVIITLATPEPAAAPSPPPRPRSSRCQEHPEGRGRFRAWCARGLSGTA